MPLDRQSVHGPKTMGAAQQTLFLNLEQISEVPVRLVTIQQKAIVGATPYLFWPMYAAANMGHPSDFLGICYVFGPAPLLASAGRAQSG